MTGSEVGRVLACPASAVLPRAVDDGGEWSEVGIERHRAAEVAVQLGDMDALPPRVAAAIEGASTLLTELALVYDSATDSARVLPWVTERGYPPDLASHEIAMTADLVALFDEPRRALVVDHKLWADQGSPREHGQLLTQALAVARAYRLQRVDVAISYLGTSWLDGPVAIDAIDLDVHAERLHELQATIALARANPAQHLRPGPHCRHCPSFLVGGGGRPCPAHQRVLSLVRSGDMTHQVELGRPFADDAAARDGYELAQGLRRILTVLDGALHARAAERPIPLGDGTVWGPVKRPGNERLDGLKVYQVAVERYGAEAARAFVEMAATKSGIKEALRAHSPRGKLTAAERAFLADLRQRGGADRKPRTSFEVHTPVVALLPESESDG